MVTLTKVTKSYAFFGSCLGAVHTSVPRNLAYRVTPNTGFLFVRTYEHSIYTPM
jgi:hypothetical protein